MQNSHSLKDIASLILMTVRKSGLCGDISTAFLAKTRKQPAPRWTFSLNAAWPSATARHGHVGAPANGGRLIYTQSIVSSG